MAGLVLSELDRLEKEAHRLASVMYGAAGGAPGGPAGGAPGGDAPPPPKDGGKKGDVIDAEFEESN